MQPSGYEIILPNISTTANSINALLDSNTSSNNNNNSTTSVSVSTKKRLVSSSHQDEPTAAMFLGSVQTNTVPSSPRSSSTISTCSSSSLSSPICSASFFVRPTSSSVESFSSLRSLAIDTSLSNLSLSAPSPSPLPLPSPLVNNNNDDEENGVTQNFAAAIHPITAAIFDSVSEAILVIQPDADKTILFSNMAATELLHYRSWKELVGKSFEAFLDGGRLLDKLLSETMVENLDTSTDSYHRSKSIPISGNTINANSSEGLMKRVSGWTPTKIVDSNGKQINLEISLSMLPMQIFNNVDKRITSPVSVSSSYSSSSSTLAGSNFANSGMWKGLSLPLMNSSSPTSMTSPTTESLLVVTMRCHDVPKESPKLPTPVSRYTTEFEEICTVGKGGFGIVVKARNRLDGMFYAIKKVKLNCKPDDVQLSLFQPNYSPLSSSNSSSLSLSMSMSSHSPLGNTHASALPPHIITESLQHHTSLSSSPSSANSSPTLRTLHSNNNNNHHQSHHVFTTPPSSYLSPTPTTTTFKKSHSRKLSEADTRLIREVKTFARISDHPNVVRYYNAWIEPQQPSVSESEYGMQSDMSSSSSSSSSSLSELTSSDDDAFSSDMDEDSEILNPRHKNLLKKPRKQPRHNATLYIQMQLCPYVDLRRYLMSRTTVNHHDSFTIFRQIAEALRHVHSKGVVHRDLKPENIFVDNGHVYLGDFGLAKTLAEHVLTEGDGDENGNHVDDLSKSNSNSNSNSTAVGTFTYASPESLTQGSGTTTKSDIYSLGIILFELFYKFSTGMERAKLLTKLKSHQEFPESFQSEFPEICEFILCCIHPDPGNRPNAEDVLEWDVLVEFEEEAWNSYCVALANGVAGNTTVGLPSPTGSIALSTHNVVSGSTGPVSATSTTSSSTTTTTMHKRRRSSTFNLSGFQLPPPSTELTTSDPSLGFSPSHSMNSVILPRRPRSVSVNELCFRSTQSSTPLSSGSISPASVMNKHVRNKSDGMGMEVLPTSPEIDTEISEQTRIACLETNVQTLLKELEEMRRAKERLEKELEMERRRNGSGSC